MGAGSRSALTAKYACHSMGEVLDTTTKKVVATLLDKKAGQAPQVPLRVSCSADKPAPAITP